jgi:hypothetical protein
MRFPGTKASFAFPDVKIADDLRHLGEVPAAELLKVGLVPA